MQFVTNKEKGNTGLGIAIAYNEELLFFVK